MQRVMYCGIFQPWTTMWGSCALLSKHLLWSTALLFRWVMQFLEHWHWSEAPWSYQVWQFAFRPARKFVFENSSLIIDSVKCSRHKSRNIKSNSMFVFLTLSHCLQDYVFWYSLIRQHALGFLMKFCLRLLY